jgi:broad specificity phosphatase PhoE
MIFLRHPRPDVPDGTCYGQLDLDIHADGLDQIRRAVRLTPPVRRILSSPALRCRELALTLSAHQDLAPEFDPRLLEMHMGEWEGMLWKDIPLSVSEPWLRDPYNRACPGGECFREAGGDDRSGAIKRLLDGSTDGRRVVADGGAPDDRDPDRAQLAGEPGGIRVNRFSEQ